MTDEFIERHGLAPGSTIVMTEEVYMTNDAWLEVSKAVVKGYRSLPYFKDNPDWYMLELLDGFKCHECVFARFDRRKNRVLQEESNTSHICQGYDQQVAKEDKKNAAEFLYETRKMQ